MKELNPTQGDSTETQVQEPVSVPEQLVPEPLIEPAIEEAKPTENTVEQSVDKLFEDKKFVDSFFARVGDGVKSIVDKQVGPAVEEAIQSKKEDSQETGGKTVEQTAPAKVETHTNSLEQTKESDDLEKEELRARLRQLEVGELEKSIRNIPEIKQLSELDSQETERFVARAKAIAEANKLGTSEVSRIFNEESEIAKDVNNQLFVLNKNTTNTINKPINKPTTKTPTQQIDKRAAIADFFYNK